MTTHQPVPPPARATSGTGFTLIEVLVASLILALALIALSSLFAFGIKNNAIAKEDTVMASFAQAKIEELKQLSESTLDAWWPTDCQASCTGVCAHPCYPTACAAADRVYINHEDPIPDPNPSDDVYERFYVRQWEIDRVDLGEPVGCVRRITVTVGSRNGVLAPKSPSGTNWVSADWTDVVGSANPRRVIVSTFR